MARSVKAKLVKKGRRTYGAIYTLPSGEKVYLAHRRTNQIYRSGKKSISEAVREGAACWAIDEETLVMMRAQGIKFVGILDRDTQDKWLTRIEFFFDPKKSNILNYSRRGGSLQRFLPLKFFKRTVGTTRIR